MSNKKHNTLDTEYGWYVEQIENDSQLFKKWTNDEPEFTTVQTEAKEYTGEAAAQIESDLVSEFVGTRPVRKPK